MDPPPPTTPMLPPVPPGTGEIAKVSPKSVSWSAMLSEVDPVPEVRIKRICTGIATGIGEPAEVAPPTGLAVTGSGAGGSDVSSGGVTIAT